MAERGPEPIEDGPRPIDVLVVASWFPWAEDPWDGRFVADQVEAIAATGAVRAAVVTFDPARLSGGAGSRARQAAAVLRAMASDARATVPLFLAPAWGVDPALPVCRLVIPEGTTAAFGAEHAAGHREAALRQLAERVAGGPSNGTPGVIHAHTVYPDGAAAIALADRLGWPLVITEHSSGVDRIVANPAVRARYAAALARADAVLAVSEMLAGELRTLVPEQASKIQVMPNAVPLGLFGQVPAPERVPDELLFVGRLKPSKGIDNLLQAVAIARTRRTSIRLRLVGRAPDAATQAAWHGRVEELDLVDAVTFVDDLDRAGVAAAMARASLFVHPSPRETFGVVAVEALASGTPVISADSGGVTEILGAYPERLGAIVPADNPDALAEAIVAALDRREDFDPAVLRDAVERRFGSSWVAERLLVVYREAIAGNRGTAFELDLPATDPRSTEREAATIVVALDRDEAVRRLSPLPAALRRELTLVTASAPAATAPPGVKRVVEVAVDIRWRPARPAGTPVAGGRAGRLLRDPVGTLRRVFGREAGSTHALRPASGAIERLARELARHGPVEIVTLDGHDHVAAEPAVRAGLVRPAGGLRRLADRWLGRGKPGEAGDGN